MLDCPDNPQCAHCSKPIHGKIEWTLNKPVHVGCSSAFDKTALKTVTSVSDREWQSVPEHRRPAYRAAVAAVLDTARSLGFISADDMLGDEGGLEIGPHGSDVLEIAFDVAVEDDEYRANMSRLAYALGAKPFTNVTLRAKSEVWIYVDYSNFD